MPNLVLNPTAQAQWLGLVEEAEQACEQRLDVELQSYLVFLLMRYIGANQLGGSVMALEYLDNLNRHGREREEGLTEVGDKCLLFSGLFPGRAERRRVRVSYYVNLGISAYAQLGDLAGQRRGSLYLHLAEHFVLLRDILQAARELNQAHPSLLPLQALELWQDTGSRRARASLRAYTQATPSPYAEFPLPPSLRPQTRAQLH